MADLKLTNVLTDAETLANAPQLAAIFAKTIGAAKDPSQITVAQAQEFVTELAKSGYRLSIPVQKGQLG